MPDDFTAFAASRHGFDPAAARARLGPAPTARDLVDPPPPPSRPRQGDARVR